VLAGGVASASAASFIAFNRQVAAPGDKVQAFTSNSRGERSPFVYKEGGVEIYVYLLPLGLASKISTPRDLEGNNVRAIGELKGDEQSIGRVSFTVPKVRPGLYSARMWCPSCGSFLPDHRPSTAGGKLGILRITKANSAGFAFFPHTFVGGAFLLFVGAVAFAFRRRWLPTGSGPFGAKREARSS
jgi:hypothetical protein